MIVLFDALRCNLISNFSRVPSRTTDTTCRLDDFSEPNQGLSVDLTDAVLENILD